MSSFSSVRRIESKTRPPYILLVISAILTTLAMSISQVSFLAWICEVFLIMYFLVIDVTPKKAFVAFFIYGLIYNMTFLYWLFNLHPLTWKGFTVFESLALTFLAWFLLSIFEALFYAVIGFIAFLFKPKSKYIKGSLVILVILLVEWIRGFGALGFPWGRLALSQYLQVNLIQTASLHGILFVTFIILSINLSIAFIIDTLRNSKLKFSLIFTLVALIIFFSNMFYGIYIMKDRINDTSNFNVSIIQGNVSVSDKWTDQSGETILDKHIRLSNEALQNDPATEYIFWAESAIPTNFTTHPDIPEYITSYSAEIDKDLIIGSILYDSSGGLRNAIISIDGTGIKDEYYKRHPVPVGEYIPFKDFIYKVFPKASESKIADEGLVPGTDPSLITIGNYKLGALVCFDSIFPELAREAVNDGANILFVASNDSWYKSSAALYQHNAQSVFRAVENRKYLVRAANTGISSLISPYGELIGVTKPNIETVLSGTVGTNSYRSYYDNVGDLFIYIMIGIFIILILLPLFISNDLPNKKIYKRKRYN